MQEVETEELRQIPNKEVYMLYEITMHTSDTSTEWGEGVSGIPAKLANGKMVKIPVLEATNTLTVGVTGTGKSKSYTLPAARHLLNSNPMIKGVFFETKRTFLDAFMQENDKVIAYDPTIVPVYNLFQWCMIKEIRQARDKEAEMRQIAEVLFGDLLTGAENNRAWIESARNTFIAVLRVIIDCYSDNTSNWDLINALRNMSVNNLLAYLAKHPRNHSLLSKDFSYEVNKRESYTPTRRATDIMFFFNSVLEIFGGAFESKGEDTIHDYLHGKYGRNLFLLHDLATAESSRPFILYFLKKIKDEKMSLSSTIKEPMLWVMDEADKLSDGGKSADFGLFQVATLGREYGLQILLTTQSVENLYGLAPGFNEHIARGGLSGFPVVLSFRPGDATTISTLQTLFGSRRRDITTMPLSRYDHPVVKSELEPIVSEADFAELDTGEAYIKIKSATPQKVSIILEEC